MRIIGWDSAVQESNNGLTLCTCGDKTKIEILEIWNRKTPLTDTLYAWTAVPEPVLLAIDAPLGWPSAFGTSVASHQAGRPLFQDELSLFKRKADISIRNRHGKVPLEISADRIARTAYFTLERIGVLERRLSRRIDLLWEPGDDFTCGMIEVYPAVTLKSSGTAIRGYKKKRESAKRKKILGFLEHAYSIGRALSDDDLCTVDHDFDSLVCCLAGKDFLDGKCTPPDEIDEEMKTEGWIWAP